MAEIGKAGVVRIKSPEGSGSGTYIGTNTVVTAAHVVAGALRVEVDFDSKRVTDQALVVAADLDSDLALVVVSGLEKLGARALTWGYVDGLPDGSPVLAVGYPGGSLSAIPGQFAGLRLEGRTILVQTDVAMAFGGSGGPLLSEAGEVVGIDAFEIPTIPGPVWFVSSTTARDFIGRTDLLKATGAAQTSVKPLVPRAYTGLTGLTYLGTLGQPFQWADGLSLTALAVQEQVPTDPMVPAAGNRFVTVVVRFENQGLTTSSTIRPEYFRLMDGSGRIHLWNKAAVGQLPGTLVYANVSVGRNVEGGLTFEVPAPDARLVLEYDQPGLALLFIRLYTN